FPGQGTQYAGMARELYQGEPVFRREVDRCAAALMPELGMDLRSALFPAPDGEEAANEVLRETRVTQPALFTVEYALAQLWMSWGVKPESMLGHSIGEYVAATLAGVFTVEAALKLVAARGRLMQSLPAGAMVAVPLPEAQVRPLLAGRACLAAVNGAASCVVSGDAAEIDALESLLGEREVDARRLHTSHAFHSAAMDPILAAFGDEVRRARPAAPSLPFLSNVTGDWITAEQATDPGYWVRHLRETVRFADGAARLLENAGRVLLEVGPGETLGTFARRHPQGAGRVIVKSLARAGQPYAADLAVCEAAGALWTAGVDLDWSALRGGEARRKVPLPAYPFERTVHRVQPRAAAPAPSAASVPGQSGTPSSTSAFSNPEPMQPPVQTVSTPAPSRASRITGSLTDLFARLLGMEPGELDADASFLELGADSLMLMQLSRGIQSTFGVRVPFRRLLEGLSSLQALAVHLDGALAADFVLPGETPAAAEAPAPAAAEPVQPAAAAPAPAPAAAAPAAPVMVQVPHVYAAPAGDGAGLQGIFAQQLAIIQSQLHLLGGGPAPMLPAVAAPAAAPVAAAPPANGTNGHAANGTNGHVGNGTTNGHAAGNGAHAANGKNGHAAPPTRLERVQAALETPDTPAKAPASHGPHRPVSATLAQGGGYTPQQAAHFQALVERYTARTRGSKEYAARNRPHLSDNRASYNFRLARKELLYPVVGERSQGTRLWDVDGNEYVDFTIGFGVHFFGHRPDFIVRAVEEQLRRGCHTGPQSDLAGPTAALLRELTGMERVTFCNTGSEAVMTALRVARAVTGNDKVVQFESSYHGCFDGILARPAATPGGRPRPIAPGTPQGMVEDVVVLPYGTPETLEYLRAHAGELAAVLVEPIQSNNPGMQPREWLHEVRAITAKSGTALIFDEMITGLRLGHGGAQEFFGVRADMATYGKVIGGGFPLGVLAGCPRFMDAIDGGEWSFGDDSYPSADQTFFAGTFCKHPVVMAAAHAVLVHLKEQGPAMYDRLHARANRLVANLRAVLEEEGVPIRVVHAHSYFRFAFRSDDPFIDLLFYHMLERGIYIWEGRGCFVSTQHTDEDCDAMVRALRESLHALREGGFLPPKPGGGTSVSAPPAPSALPSAQAAEFALTPAQRQVWVASQLGEDASRAYHVQFLVGVQGRLDAAALRAAVEDLVAHHASLRTVFDPSGETQRVLPSLPALPLAVDASTGAADPERLAEAMRRAMSEGFDLQEGPLFRVHLHADGPDQQVLQFVGHHIAADG
ncbi:MAG TPA: aminotransferase class III-fold pyridoxal phosphate-dependent enzyme, partial [Longimicrobium sp.]|nr:aminotransferase class III-fold pyridoxal phosphate-dependent enzyme [Longimicrobium sp.]